MRVLYVLVALSIFCGSPLAVADGNAALCHEYLPSSIKQTVKDSYKGWHVASMSVLNQSDRERFKPFIKNECYGLIRGNFTGVGTSYAIYMLRTQGNGYMDQLVVLQEVKGRVQQYVLLPPQFSASATILKKIPRQTSITDIDTGENSVPLHDVIDLEDPDKGAIVFFWKAGKFISVTTSE